MLDSKRVVSGVVLALVVGAGCGRVAPGLSGISRVSWNTPVIGNGTGSASPYGGVPAASCVPTPETRDKDGNTLTFGRTCP